MRKLLYLIVVIVALGLIVTGCLPTVPPAEQSNTDNLTKGSTINVPADYSTIQEAINAASSGDTINVGPGTYNENITIDKSLTIVSVDGPEVTILNAQPIDDFSFGVLIYGIGTVATFDGFTVGNYHRVGILAGSYSLNQNDYPNPSVVHILNNIVSEPIGQHNNNCIQVGFGTTGTIIGNEVFGAVLESPDYSGSGILLSCSSNVLVSNNYVHDCEGGIQIMGWPTSDLMGPAEDNIIEYNLAQGNESGIVAQQNAIGTIIRYNDALNNASGIVSVGWFNSPGYFPSGTQIHFNNIVGNANYGVRSYTWDEGEPEQVDATCNWWGYESGPDGMGPGTGDAVSSNVDFSPWLLSLAPDAVCHDYNWYGFEEIVECIVNAKNHGQFVSCVAHLTNDWLENEDITAEDKDAIMSWAAESDIGKK